MIDFPCTYCGAQPGDPCTVTVHRGTSSERTVPKNGSHTSRFYQLQAASAAGS